MEDEARGDGEQENGICLENRNGGRGRGRRGTGERDLPGEQEPEDAARGDGEQENRIGLENRNQRTRRGETGGRRETGKRD